MYNILYANPLYIIEKYFAIQENNIMEAKDRCDISRNSVSLIETGKINPTILRVVDIARVLGVDINALIKDA